MNRISLAHRRRSARTLLVGLAVVVLALATGAALSHQASAAPKATTAAVTLKVGGQTDGLKSLLNASGALKGKTYTVQWATFTSGPPIVEALQAGRIDLGGVGNTPPIFGAATRPNFRLVAAVQQKSHSADHFIVPGDSKIRLIRQLIGKKIAYTRGSSGHGFLVQALKRAGIKLSQVKLVDLQPGDALAAFNSGAVDAWATWEPFLSIAQAGAKHARVVAAGTGYAASGLQFELATTALLGNRTKLAAAKDYLRRLRNALIWGNAHKATWAQGFSKETGLPYALSLQFINRTATSLTGLGAAQIGQEQTLANALAAAGVVKRVNIKSISYNLAG